MALFDCYFRAFLRLTRQMLNARVQHLPDCLKKLDARIGQVLSGSRRNSQALANRVYDLAAWACLVSGAVSRRWLTFLWLVHCASFISTVKT
jgi:hypothetical protein